MDKIEAKFLDSTSSLDAKSEAIQNYVSEFSNLNWDKEKAIGLYLKVRDGFLYDPYHLDLRPEVLKASVIVQKRRAWCVEKAIVLCAGLRALNIPSRLGFGIVKNHVGVERLVHYLRKEEIVFHGYCSVFIDGKWVKCTPAFDKRICALSGVDPLVWDGENDSMFQPYRKDDQLFMEYLYFYGEFDDVPFQLMHEEMALHYPHLFDPLKKWEEKAFSFTYSSHYLKEV